MNQMPPHRRHAEQQWNGVERRRYARWQLQHPIPLNLLSPEAGHISVTDVSEAGLAGNIQPVKLLLHGTIVKAYLPDVRLSFHARVQNALRGRIGFSLDRGESANALIRLAQERQAVTIRETDGSLRVEGFLGFNARRELRTIRTPAVIDLAGATGIDSFGLGILLGHVQRGCRLSGCRGMVAELINIAGLCDRSCRKPGASSTIPCPVK